MKSHSTLRITLSLLFALSLVCPPARAQSGEIVLMQTLAERTGFLETSRYADVEAMTDAVAAASPMIHKTYFAYTNEGRALPLLVFGDVADASATSVLASGRTRVFIQANIHAGEVCGKEAMLIMLRDLANGGHASWADSLVVLVAPIYNADGNERFHLTNRGLQNGPLGGMGQRPNAQGLDLNRDHMKLDSPEARSLVALFNAYDPHVVVDLHTTNGTRHAYHLTYSPPLHPNTPPAINSMLRDSWLPAVTDSIRKRTGWEFYYYGNVPRRGEAGWYTFDHRPRFNNNYTGLRNRFAILSEAYAYASFEERIRATLHFVEEILGYAHDNAEAIREITDAADAEDIRGTSLAVRADFERSAEPVDILMGEVEEARNPYSGERFLVRTEARSVERMYEYGTFAPTESEVAPAAYYVPAGQHVVLDRLRDHGVVLEQLASDGTRSVERFRIDSLLVAPNEYQGHFEHDLRGAWETETIVVPAGTYRVDVNQPLGRLIFSLLEPRSDDGFAVWGLVQPGESPRHYPIVRSTGNP